MRLTRHITGSEDPRIARAPVPVYDDPVGTTQSGPAREAGLRIPDDIAVAGFDDVPMARYVTPPLTTVRVRIAELGRLALEQLCVQIADPGSLIPVHQRVTATLVIRDSTASLAGEPASTQTLATTATMEAERHPP